VTRLALISSPLLGPAVWRPAADALRQLDHPVLVVAPSGRVDDPADVVRGLLAELPEGEPLILVPHSNAGLYVAALAAEREVAGVVFVDAGLPSESPETPTAPVALRRHLSGLADADGLLPPWTQWWPDVTTLFPDLATRRRVEGEQRRLPLRYFEAAAPSPPGWERLPAAYLAFGDTYTDERADAQQRGWPVETMAGEHLHMLVDPSGVAAAVIRLAHSLGR
jgi:hypothetical protein